MIIKIWADFLLFVFLSLMHKKYHSSMPYLELSSNDLDVFCEWCLKKKMNGFFHDPFRKEIEADLQFATRYILYEIMYRNNISKKY